ncbi:MAG: divergent polysaccharide deacetylase family protein [Desulfovibrionaceae bacterium]|nr:divergent polysaccharide deacetylase family protein [Desulfovibrionaceae bacterium]
MLRSRPPGSLFPLLLACGLLFASLTACRVLGEDREGAADPSGIGQTDKSALLYEEMPDPGFTDYINQVDYALAQTMHRLGVSTSGLRVLSSGLKDHGGRLYQVKQIFIAGVRDFPLFAQTLRDSLVAWADRAVLLRDEGPGMDGGTREWPAAGAWSIALDGVVTHYLLFSSDLRPALDPRPGPRLTIVMDDLGESLPMISRLLALNFRVSFAVWPYSTHAPEVDALAWEHGVELLAHQPMEPEGYPQISPGRGALMWDMSAEELTRRLDEGLDRLPHASGLNNHMGSLLTQDAGRMRLVAEVAQKRGLFVLDSLTHQKSRLAGSALELGITAWKRDIFLDVDPRKEKILEQLRQAERIAAVRGQAIAIGHPFPATLEALEEWQHLRGADVSLSRLEDLTPLRAASNNSFK